MGTDAVYIGMDLGAFKTSVVSSNGRRDVLASAVGWAKDIVAESMLGTDVVFGEEVFQQRLAVEGIRPFERGVLKYLDRADSKLSDEKARQHQRAAKLLINHVVGSMLPDSPKVPVYGMIGAPSRASVESKEVILDAANEAFDSVMIIPEPFAVAYGINRLTKTLVIDIGAGTIDICPIYGAYPKDEDQITVPLGGDAIDIQLCEIIESRHPEVKLTRGMAREMKEQYGLVPHSEERALVDLPVDGKPRSFDLTDELREACSIIVPPLLDGVREVISRFDPEFQLPLSQNILLAGGGSQLRGLDRVIEKELDQGGHVKRIYDSVYAGAAGALKLAMRVPDEQWHSIAAA